MDELARIIDHCRERRYFMKTRLMVDQRMRTRAVWELCEGQWPKLDKALKEVQSDPSHPFNAVILATKASALPIEAEEKKHAKAIEKLAKSLPLWTEHAVNIRGLGPLTFGSILGALGGDPADYKSPAAVWKRMGLAVIGGIRQRKMTGDLGILHGYNPERRSLMWNIGACFLKSGGELRELYDQRKEYELTKTVTDKDGKEVAITKGHAHNRALRYVEKRLLRDLWKAARRLRNLPDAPFEEAA